METTEYSNTECSANSYSPITNPGVSVFKTEFYIGTKTFKFPRIKKNNVSD